MFKDETIKRFEGYFRRLIHSIATGSINGKIKDLEIITEEEMNRILHEFNDTATDYPQDKTIHQLFQEQAARTPDRVALVGDASGGPAGSPRGGSPWNPNASARVKGRVQTTYRQLDRESDRLAALLQNNGVAPDTIVAIMAERSVEMIIGLLTIVKAGGAYLPIDSDTPADRMLYMLADSQAKIMLTGQTGEPGADELRKKGIEIIDLSQMSNRRQGGKEPAGFNVEPSSRQSASLLAYVMYTSGTTGRPKAVMVEHRSVVRLVVNTGYIDFKRYRSLLQTGTLSFDASTFEIWGALENGLTLYLVKKDDILSVENLKQNVNTYGIDVMWMTSALFNNHIREDIGIFESIKHLLVGGDVVSPVHVNRLREEYPGIRVTNGYGPTENTTFSTCMPVERDYFDKIPIGGPISNSTAYIVDSNSRLCPIGVPGELLVGGDGLARGYLNHPELTAESFIETGLHIKSFAELFQKRPPGGNTPPRVAGPPEAPVTDGIYYRTGDLTRWQPDGTIEFLGRIDSQVKIRGFRIELAEIETRLLTYPGVVEAVVLARQSQSGEKYLCAYYVAESPLSPEAGLKDHLAQYLPDYMVPSHFVQQEKFPLTPNGKVDRKALSRLAASRFQAPTYTAPRNETEKKLVEIWAEVLELNDEKISVDTDFFQIGGHSLRATILATRINKAFNVSIPLAQVFQAPTMEKLARYIDTMPQKKTTHEKDDSLVLLRSMVPPDAPTQHEASLNLRGGFEVGEKHSRANGCTSMVPPARGAAGGSSPCTPNKPSAENLFLVHDGSGDLEGYVAFCNLLNPTFNCWGIRATPMEDCAPQNRAIEDIAGTYIDKIAKIQPEGPYRIVGWSIGGTIAFEMVRQLEQKNKQIAFFGMIDSMAPKPANHPSQKADPFSVEAEWDWVKDHLPATGPDTDIETELKRVKDVRSFWSIIVRYLSEMDIQTLRQSIPEAYRMVIPNFEGQGVEGVISYVNMIRTMSNAGDRYLPADKIKTPVHFFGASETGISGQKDWNKYLEQPFTYYQIEGDHFSILKPPLVNAFARQFNSVMP
ncbi:MAG: amino acid adenylation domain-containing protein [bacterium]|nr:amino acid adenylation domain-containing protein [bacterium]